MPTSSKFIDKPLTHEDNLDGNHCLQPGQEPGGTYFINRIFCNYNSYWLFI